MQKFVFSLYYLSIIAHRMSYGLLPGHLYLMELKSVAWFFDLLSLWKPLFINASF